MAHSAKILADSISPDGVRLTTFLVVLPRIVLAEINTHRVFCLAGDADLEFDMPGGKIRRVQHMRLDVFVDKWLHGARRTGANPKRATETDWAEPGVLYSAPEVASHLGMASASNINLLCRTGDMEGRKKGKTWFLDGAEVQRWRTTVPQHTRFDIRERLQNMRIRQINEDTGDVQTAHVVGVSVSGYQEVFEVKAGDFQVAGSKNHNVLTSEGWKNIGALVPGDLLVVRKFGKRDEDKLDPLRLKKIDGRWRSVWQRDQRDRLQKKNRFCRRCKQRAGTTIHHLVAVHEAPTRAFDLDNITLLCDPCHTLKHEKQGWQGGTYLYGSMVAVDSVTFRGEEETYDLEISGRYPNFLANGVVVHNSRNSASSRAIPIKKMLKRVMEDPYIPTSWGKNQKGMQAEVQMSLMEVRQAEAEWLLARDNAVRQAQRLLDIGLHKQITNRLLEPWLWHTCIITATEYTNFFNLRCNKMAHPDIQIPARLMRDLYQTETPKEVGYGEWHLPLVFEEDWALARVEFGPIHLTTNMAKISCARCGRVSYMTHEGKRDLKEDLKLYDRLLEPGHMSPFEHAARPMDPDEMWKYRTGEYSEGGAEVSFCGNVRGWISHRKTIPYESDILGTHDREKVKEVKWAE